MAKISDTPFHVRVDYTRRYAELVEVNERIDFLPERGAIVAKFADWQDAADYAQFKSSAFLSHSVWEEGSLGYTLRSLIVR